MLSRLDNYGLNRRLAVPTGLPQSFDFSNLPGGLAIDVYQPFPYRPANPVPKVLCAARQRSPLTTTIKIAFPQTGRSGRGGRRFKSCHSDHEHGTKMLPPHGWRAAGP